MILYNKTATRYWYQKNQYWVSSYDSEWVRFACNVQPLDQSDGFDEATVYKMKKLYCEYSWNVVWDKIVVDWTAYIVKSIQSWNGSKRKFYKIIMSESEWN